MTNFVTNNPSISTAIGILTVSAAVSSLPPPTDTSAMAYRWFYKFSNTLLANVSALRGKAQYEDAKPSDSASQDKEKP